MPLKHINDVHHASPVTDPFFAQLVTQMRGHKHVRFLLVVGDLADQGRPESLQAFTGHYHARTETTRGPGVLLTNACCARVRDNHDQTIPEGYLLCTAHPDGTLDREFVRFAPAELSVKGVEA